MSKEPDKVEEPSTPYVVKTSATKTSAGKSTTDGIKHADDAAFKKAMDKVFETHKELFRKLAQ